MTGQLPYRSVLTYERVNDSQRMIVVLNDNEWSIDRWSGFQR